MPVDDRDESPLNAGASPIEKKAAEPEVAAALQSKTDAPLPPVAEKIAEQDADSPQPQTPQGERRRYLTRRNAFIATLALGGILIALVVGGLILYRVGYVDRYIANQIVSTLAEFGVRADIKEFHTVLSPRTVEMSNIDLYDAKTNAKLAHANRLLAKIRIEDLYALNLRRNINLEALDIDGLEAWVAFDEQGRSNFDNLRLPPPDPNQRILFSYSTAKIALKDAVVHYGDEQHNLSGTARNIRATVEPDDPNAPAESWMNKVAVALSDSTFVYDGRPVDHIDVEAHGRVNQTRAEIQDLTLRSPVAEAHLQGTMDDWRALRYQMNVTSTVDLTQASDVLQTGATLRGAGNFIGTVTGEGTRYQVNGEIKSDALAADNIRLKALNLNATASGDGASYNITGRAVAELLTAGDFQLNALQLAGNVMGTGTDFRWVGDLRAAAARGPGPTTIAGLILRDVKADVKDKTITANAGGVSVDKLLVAGANISGARVSGVRVRSENGVVTASAANAQAGAITAKGARVNGASIAGVTVTSRDGATTLSAKNARVGTLNAQGARVNNATTGTLSVVQRGSTTNIVADNVRVGGANAFGASIGSINIAGVRLAIHDGGRVEGSSSDVNAGTVAYNGGAKSTLNGRVENVRLAHPVFTLEPSGHYRASADLSLGGGVLGQVKLGAARANIVATNSAIQANNFTADIFNGRASGNAVVSTARNGASRISADFGDLDIGNLAAVLSGRVVPLVGKATGNVDLTFPGTDVASASGNLRAQFAGDTGTDASARTPLTGDVALRADRGLFNIERANLRTAASELNASGQFSLERDSNLQINLASTDASELQRVLVASGIAPSIEDQLNDYKIELGGKLAFNGTVRGALAAPNVDGRASLDSLIVGGRDLGSLAATINATPALLRVADGRLVEPDGGGAQFALNVPLTDTNANNISLDATLDRVNVGDLIVALNQKSGVLADTQSDLSGRINVTGLPGNASGNADLRFGAGRIGGQPFESIAARATFNGSNVNLETVDARFDAGRVVANGTLNLETLAVNLQAQANNIQLDRLAAFAGNASSLPQLTGTANITASATGTLKDYSSLQVNINGEGRDVTINGRQAGALTLVGRTENKIFDLRLTTGIFGQPQVIAARVDLSNSRLPTTIETTLTGTDLTPLFAALLPADSVKIRGRATGSFNASGNLADEDGYPSLAGLRGTARFTDLSFQVEDVQLTATAPLIVQFSSNEIFFEKTQFTGPGTNVTFGGTAALSGAGRQNLSIDGKLNLRILNSISPDIFLSGTAEASVRVTGTYDQPRLLGTASVGGASFSTLVGDQRLTVANVAGLVRFNSNQAQLESLTGTLGGGRVVASGGALLAGFAPTRFRLSVRGDNVTVPLPQDFRSTADADLTVSGTTREQVITGTVNLRRAEYTQDIELADLINRRREISLSEGGGGDSAFGATTQLDLRVVGRDALVVRNNLVDVVGSVTLNVGGTIDDPVVAGRVTASRGTLKFRNDRYELTRAFIDLPARSLSEADPLLNIQAESEIKGYRVIVALTGPLSRPDASVRSDPALPQSDVVALITTGDLSSGDTSASGLAQSGLGTAASLLTDSLINNSVRRASDKLFGLRVEIDPLISGRGGASPTARLKITRPINRNLTVTYSTNVTSDQNQVLAVEYRLSDRMSFVAQYEQGSVNGLSSRNDNFNFEIRFRKRF